MDRSGKRSREGDAHLRCPFQKVAARCDPSGIDLAVAIDELHVGEAVRQGLQISEAGVARARRRERKSCVEDDRMRTKRRGERDRAVERSGIDVDDISDFSG